MENVDEARLKSEFAKALSDEITATVTNSEKNVIGLTAARDVVAQILARFKDYSDRITVALADGTFPPESDEAVKAVHTDLTSLVENAQKEIAKAADSQLFFTRGLQRAAAMIEARGKAEKDLVESMAALVPAPKVEAPVSLPPLAASPSVSVETPVEVSTTDAVARIEVEAAAALLASLPPEKAKRKRAKSE